MHPRATQILLFLFTKTLLFGQNLLPGDLAVLGVSANTFDCTGTSGGDEISFVTFKDIETGTTLDLTDNGYERCLPNLWGDSEGIVRFTRTGTTIPAGTVLTYRLTNPTIPGTYQFLSPDNAWTVQNLNLGAPPATPVNLNSGGDQLFFLSGGTWDNNSGTTGNDATYSGNILFGFSTNGNWTANCANTPTENSNLPPSLVPCFHMEPTSASDFAKYTGPLTSATRLEWLDRIRRVANWSVFPTCTAYSAAAPDFVSGKTLTLLPTKIGITSGASGVCPGDTAFLGMNLPSIGGPFQVSWTDGVNTFSANGITPTTPLPVIPKASAIFSISGLQDNNGCKITPEVNVKFFLELFPSQFKLIRDTTCNPAQAGIFTQNLTNQKGCDSTIRREILYEANYCEVKANVFQKSILCAGGTDGLFTITVVKGFQPFDFQWIETNSGQTGSGQIAKLNEPKTVADLPAGQYQITITDANGTTASYSANLTEPPPLGGTTQPQLDYGNFAIRCANSSDGHALALPSGGSPPYAYLWPSGETGALAEKLTAGLIPVTIIDARGCTETLGVNIEPPPPFVAKASVFGEECFGQNTGRICVDTVFGGQPPFIYALENQALGANHCWENLPPGEYFFQVADAIGCQFEFGAVLPEGPKFDLDANPDTSVFDTDTLLFSQKSARPLAKIEFAPAGSVQVITTELQLIFPEYTTQYHIRARDTAGCLAEGDLLVRVKRERSVFAPNIFSPTAKLAENQRFTLFGDVGIVQILELEIFDRWGNEVFRQANFPAGTGGWNGQIAGNGQQALPGVYAWFARVRLSNGLEKWWSGEVTLLRQ